MATDSLIRPAAEHEDQAMDDSERADLIIRLERFCADLYRTVPLEGHGVLDQAAEIAHAAELDEEAGEIESGSPDADAMPSLTPRDIRVACQLLIDVRRAPALQEAAEVALARKHFPEVEDDTLDRLERLIAFYTDLASEPGDDGGV
ncbi:MAG: hypothetical protein HYX51_02460 [Chloroflexi bacterium]|nr:hypothetical protein [Chloroflexota bacterium]